MTKKKNKRQNKNLNNKEQRESMRICSIFGKVFKIAFNFPLDYVNTHLNWCIHNWL